MSTEDAVKRLKDRQRELESEYARLGRAVSHPSSANAATVTSLHTRIERLEAQLKEL